MNEGIKRHSYPSWVTTGHKENGRSSKKRTQKEVEMDCIPENSLWPNQKATVN
jgi:hypothetical protein